MLKKMMNLALILTIGLIFVSCSEDSNPSSSLPEGTETLKLDASDHTLWHYFSFSEGKVVGTGSADPTAPDDAEWKIRTDWDIAFNRYHVRTNSGTSGDGKGGMMVAETTEFSDNIRVDGMRDTFTADSTIEIVLVPKFPPTLIPTSGSVAAEGWAVHNNETMEWEIAKKVFVVRTAVLDQNNTYQYAKIWLESFLDEDDQSGTVTMHYAYPIDYVRYMKP